MLVKNLPLGLMDIYVSGSPIWTCAAPPNPTLPPDQLVQRCQSCLVPPSGQGDGWGLQPQAQSVLLVHPPGEGENNKDGGFAGGGAARKTPTFSISPAPSGGAGDKGGEGVPKSWESASSPH